MPAKCIIFLLVGFYCFATKSSTKSAVRMGREICMILRLLVLCALNAILGVSLSIIFHFLLDFIPVSIRFFFVASSSSVNGILKI